MKVEVNDKKFTSIENKISLFLRGDNNMPIFTYKCIKCKEIFDRLEGVTSKEDELKCPKCGSKEAEKQLSVFSVGKSAGGSSAASCPTCNLS